MNQKTCYVHCDEESQSLIMRAERYLPSWVRDMRDGLGEDAVQQIRVKGKVAWAVPWGMLEDAMGLMEKHFNDIMFERESFLGFGPFSEERAAEFVALTERKEKQFDDIYPIRMPVRMAGMRKTGGQNDGSGRGPTYIFDVEFEGRAISATLRGHAAKAEDLGILDDEFEITIARKPKGE